MVTLKRMRSIDGGLGAFRGGGERRPRRRVNILKTGSTTEPSLWVEREKKVRKRPGAGLLLSNLQRFQQPFRVFVKRKFNTFILQVFEES